MRSLEGLKRQIRELLEARREMNKPPTALLVLPSNGREPSDDTRPFPRLNRTGAAAIVIYDPAVGPPSAEEIHQLIARTQ